MWIEIYQLFHTAEPHQDAGVRSIGNRVRHTATYYMGLKFASRSLCDRRSCAKIHVSKRVESYTQPEASSDSYN